MESDTRSTHILITISPAFLALSLFTGCTSTRLIDVKQSTISTTSMYPNSGGPTLSSTTSIIGVSVEGREIQCFTIGNGSDTVLFIAGIHGDEAAGVPLVNRLYQELTTSGSITTHHRILIVPQANPDAVAHD